MKKFFFLLTLTCLFSFCKNEKPKTSTPPTLPKTVHSEAPIIAPTDAFIKKYEGTIGDNNPIELVLINWSNGFLGGYYIYKNKKSKQKKFELSGDLHLNESFILEAYIEDNIVSKFHGSLSELSTINGTWSNADSSQSMTYTLKEAPHNDKVGWSGAWYRNNTYAPGILILGNVTDKTVDFAIEVFNNGHNGILEGTANINGGIATYNTSLYGNEELCDLVFQKHNNQITVNQKSSSWACGFGVRAQANGKYDNHFAPEKAALAYGKENNIFTNQKSHDIFKEMVGDDYEAFAFNMQSISIADKNEADKFDAKVYKGNVIGLDNSNEAIIMKNDKNVFWAAVTIYDEANDSLKIKYHTNDKRMKNMMPHTIARWAEGLGLEI